MLNKEHIYQDLWDQYCRQSQVMASHELHVIYTKITILTRDPLGLSWFINEFFQTFKQNGSSLGKTRRFFLNNFFSEDQSNISNTYKLLESINNEDFTIAILKEIESDVIIENNLAFKIIDNHLDYMIRKDLYIIGILKSPMMTEKIIDSSLKEIDLHYPLNIKNLEILFQNKNITSNQLDKLSQILQRDPDNLTLRSLIWLRLAIHPNSNYSLIKQYLNNPSIVSALYRRPSECKNFVKNCTNKSILERMAILELFPFLKEYGLNSSILDSAIEVLGG